jgi:cell division protein FtsB
VILLVVFALLVVSYASSMRAYLNQRSQIDQLLSQIDNYDTHIRSVKAEIGRWNDPNYVVQQARSRFGWVLPGEIAYQVLDSNGEPMTGKDKLADPSTVAHPTRTPEAWWTKIADSAQAADQPKILVRKPPPVTKITSKGANNQ